MTKKELELVRKYPYIYAWGKYLLSFDYYIVQQCERAEEEDAPKDSIYYDDREGKWCTTNDLKHPELKDTLDSFIKQLNKPK